MRGKPWAILAGAGMSSCECHCPGFPGSWVQYPSNSANRDGSIILPHAADAVHLENNPWLTAFRLTKNRPFFKKSETFHPPSPSVQQRYDVTHDADLFGRSGPIQISYPTDYSPSHALWHKTLNAVGVETNSSHVDGSNVGVWTTVNAVKPQSASRSWATDYCSPQPPNLHILTHATVNEIILEQDVKGQNVATGVRFVCQGKEHVVSVSREIILSAGSIKSPQILELSGIGNPEVLARASVPVKVESPTVGENLQDHLSKLTRLPPTS